MNGLFCVKFFRATCLEGVHKMKTPSLTCWLGMGHLLLFMASGSQGQDHHSKQMRISSSRETSGMIGLSNLNN